MRCTKCSFISFDDLLACAKCASDLSRLSKELNGTCIETRQEFFLGRAIQATGMEEDSFSDSQMLPPIEHGDMNFDDTATGGFSPISSAPSDASGFGLDDSVTVAAEDDIAIELGDIMPIDFDQLDSGHISSEGALENTDALPFGDFNLDVQKTDSISASADNEIDFDLTDGLVDTGSDFNFDDDLSTIDFNDSAHGFPDVLSDGYISDSNKTTTDVNDLTDTSFQHQDAEFHLDQDLFEQLADVSGSFDETTSLNNDAGLNETQVSLLTVEDDVASSLELDESLVAELAGASPLDVSGRFPMNFTDDHSASGDFELDAALVAELGSGEDAVGNVAADADDFSNPLKLTANEVLSSAQVGDLTGDFPSLREEDDDELSGLDLADIDVSDLVDASDRTSPSNAADSSLKSQQAMFGEQSEPVSTAVEDAVDKEYDSREYDSVNLHVEDEVVLDLEGDGLDEIKSSGLNIKTFDPEMNSPEGTRPHAINISSLDDTFREDESAVALKVSYDDEPLDDILDEELVLDSVDGGNDSLPDIDAMSLDADFEAFLSSKGAVDKLPEIELISDDDDDEDGPPDLPV